MHPELFASLSPSVRTTALARLFEDFSQLGFFDRHGTSCVVMADLAARALHGMGYRVQLQTCQAEFIQPPRTFLLGAPEFVRPGQVSGHLVVIVEDEILLDFGLGNVRKYFHSDFYRAVALPLLIEQGVLAQHLLDNQILARWRPDVLGEDMRSALAEQASYVERTYQDYLHYKRNRIGFLLHRLGRSAPSIPHAEQQCA